MRKTEVNTRDSYALYSEIVENPVPSKTYIEIANSYMQFLFEKVIEGEEVTLPAKMGTISIEGRKREIKSNEEGLLILPPNWRATKELWDRNPQAKEEKKIVYCLNEETGGVSYRLHWSRNKIPLENKSLYSLIITRLNKRNISKAIKAGKEYTILT